MWGAENRTSIVSSEPDNQPSRIKNFMGVSEQRKSPNNKPDPQPASKKIQIPPYAKIPIRICFDIFMLIIAYMPVYIPMTPPKRGFYCGDTTIAYPMKEENGRLMGVKVIFYYIPMLMIVSTNVISNFKKPSMTSYGIKMPALLVMSYREIVSFLLGGFFCVSSVEVLRNHIGALRPYFLMACKPSFDCTGSKGLYVRPSDYNCTNEHPPESLRDSFPSIGAACSSYSTVFLLIFIEDKFKWNGSFLLKRLFQFLCLSFGMCSMMLRYHDFRAHWYDLVGGLLLGASLALIICASLFLFKKPDKPDQQQKDTRTSPQRTPSRTASRHGV